MLMLFRNLKNSLIKAPGVSDIANEVLKNLPISYIPKFILLFNSLFKFNYFPHCWKLQSMLQYYPPPKKKKHIRPASSFRPISLLESSNKLAEVFIARLLHTFIEENSILTPDQFGFRKNFSALHQVYRLVEHITTGKTKKHYMAAIFCRYWKSIRESVDFRPDL